MSWIERIAAAIMAAIIAASSPAEPEVLEPPVSEVYLDPFWEFADFSVIHSGAAVLYRSQTETKKGITVGVNAGHGTAGGESACVYCHPDLSPKITGGSTAEGSVQAMAVAVGMTFNDGSIERDATLREAQMLKDLLLAEGYDVLMLRDSEDVQLDNVARTVLCNNMADCHISLHWDGDGLDYDKGCFYMAVPDGLKSMYPVSGIWQENDRLGECLVAGLAKAGLAIFDSGFMQIDLVQTSYSKVPSVDVELGNQCSSVSDEDLMQRANGLLSGINSYFDLN